MAPAIWRRSARRERRAQRSAASGLGAEFEWRAQAQENVASRLTMRTTDGMIKGCR